MNRKVPSVIVSVELRHKKRIKDEWKVRKQKEKNAKRIILGRRERKKMPRNLKVRKKMLAYEETLRKGLQHVREKFGEIMTTVRSKTFAVEGA